MKHARHSDLFQRLEDAELYTQQKEMAANVGQLKSKDAKRRQARMLVRSLVKRARIDEYLRDVTATAGIGKRP